MHRLLVEASALSEDSPRLPPSAARHLKVLRPKTGEPVELFDGRGRSRVYRWEGESGLKAVSAASFAERPPPLTLFACVTKGSRWDWTVEKSVELGVTRIVPVLSARTIVRLPPGERAGKCARWRRIAEDAARQSDAKWLPEILEAVDFEAAAAMAAETTCFTGALTEPPSPPLAAAVAGTPPGNGGYAVFIGPEGDFTSGELASLAAVSVPTSFGPSILRAETAAVFAVSVVAALSRAVTAA
ncbi:MAG: 16S rRNA (uracil(1498)-N(3))-methyltransferase [Kiritimatiellae bacterium]|nr:16S rRNA (uracil(1498)-N(3))-methyltransferase [Kiritimatiellia bacterium]